LQLLLGAIGALPSTQFWKLGLMLSIQDAQAFGKELTEAVVGYHDIGINDNLASTRVEIDVLGCERGRTRRNRSRRHYRRHRHQNAEHSDRCRTRDDYYLCVWHRRQTHRPDCHIGGVSALIEAIAKNIDTRRQLAKKATDKSFARALKAKMHPSSTGQHAGTSAVFTPPN
jgi:hypothetical protein